MQRDYVAWIQQPCHSLADQLCLGSKQDYYEDCIQCCREKMVKEPAKCHLAANQLWILFGADQQNVECIGIPLV